MSWERHGGVARTVAAVLVAGCTAGTDVTVRIQPPPLVDGGTAGLDGVYATGPRCMVFAAAPLGGTDTTVHAVAVRAAQVVPAGPGAQGAPPCMGASGAVLLDGLSPDTTYLLELVLLDPVDWSAPVPDETVERIVSLQDYPLVGNPGTPYICLSAPMVSRVFPPVLARGAALCAAAVEVPRCTLDVPYGGLCPVGTR